MTANNSSSSPTDPQDEPPNPAKRGEHGAASRLRAHVALLDLRRPAICLSLGHPLVHPNLDQEIVAVKITVHHALLTCEIGEAAVR